MIGKTLGHYQISSQLGKGGMGEVYQAQDQVLGRDVAIKVLPDEFATDAERVARFQREAKLLASLNHPNIAAIHKTLYQKPKAGFDREQNSKNGSSFFLCTPAGLVP